MPGAWPSSRRGHAAVVQGDSLWVHGGLDSRGQHLQDLWRLDLHKWQWQQLEGKVRLQAYEATCIQTLLHLPVVAVALHRHVAGLK